MGRVLGEGQPGTTTYLCKDKHTQEAFACKSISKTRNLDIDEDVVNVELEVAIMAHLPEHPNIVSLYDIFTDEHADHLVMELCEGGELLSRIATKGRPCYTELQAARLMRTIMEAVHTCHKHGVMHRDLKPENFLFVDKTEDSPLKVIDFGLSVFFKPKEKFYDVLGTPGFMAPEIWRAAGKGYGPKVDVWSAGIILYFMLTQEYPFAGKANQGLSWETLCGKLDLERHPWPMVSDSAKSLVRHMLELNPKARYNAEEVLNHPWLYNEQIEEKCQLGGHHCAQGKDGKI